jgi:tRNA-uridine 2-sulfurtransferase
MRSVTERPPGIRAVGLLSGGLDSTIAAKMLIDQGIEVHAVNFTSPFCTCTPKSAGCASVLTAVRQLGGIPLKRIALSDEYLEIVKSPKHGHGRGMNPCIDCRIMKIRKATEFMTKIGAAFLFTGEVVGQRPMSQHRRALNIIDRESGIEGLILRPLSARILEPTVPERKGWVDRKRLMDVTGKSRKIQMSMASSMNVTDYPCPAGGCLLTEKAFADRLRDYFRHTEKPSVADMALLRTGRHFRMENGDWIVVGRDRLEGERLIGLKRRGLKILEPDGFSAPVVALEGSDIRSALEKMKEYTHHPVLPEYRVILHEGDAVSLLLLRDVLATG